MPVWSARIPLMTMRSGALATLVVLDSCLRDAPRRHSLEFSVPLCALAPPIRIDSRSVRCDALVGMRRQQHGVAFISDSVRCCTDPPPPRLVVRLKLVASHSLSPPRLVRPAAQPAPVSRGGRRARAR